MREFIFGKNQTGLVSDARDGHRRRRGGLLPWERDHDWPSSDILWESDVRFQLCIPVGDDRGLGRLYVDRYRNWDKSRKHHKHDNVRCDE